MNDADRRGIRRRIVATVATAVAAAGLLGIAGLAVRPASGAGHQAGPPGPLAMLGRARPLRDGEVDLPGLTAAVRVARDDRGVPEILAEGPLADAIRGQGFVHAQERFFQMDLARLYAAGRVAELAGEMLLETDTRMRRLGLEAVAEAVVAGLPPAHRELLETYAAGVNAGLEALGDPPIELLQVGLTRGGIEPWRPRDTVLVLLFMWDFLNRDAAEEPWRGMLRDAVDPAVFEFLATQWHRDDVLADGRRDPAGPPPMPSVEQVVAMGEPAAPAPAVRLGLADRGDESAGVPGSNAWAVAGSRTVHGRAILAGDPHLMLAAPGVWYRATLRWRGGEAHGVSLPGSPGILIGSNARVAWSFTNTTGDFQDLVLIEPDPADPSRYRVPGGTEPFLERIERIVVRGGEDVDLSVRVTRWGPVVGEVAGRPAALRWTGLDAEAMNFDVLELMRAAGVEEALDIAAGWGGPSQNIVVAGADGRIGWTITGFLPDRAGFDGRTPRSWADGSARWRAESGPRPRIVDPEGGVIVTANNRTMPLAEARRIGSGFAHPGRAARITERLAAMPIVDERAMLALQLDDRVHGFLAWRDLVLEAFTGGGGGGGVGAAGAAAAAAAPETAEVLAALAAWDGRADLDARVLPVLAGVRVALGRVALERLLAPAGPAVADRVRRSLPWDEPALRILMERPPHLLPGEDGRAVIRDAVNRVVAESRAEGRDPLRPWREENLARVRHPLSPVVPELSAILDMPPLPVPGHWWAVRVHSGTFGVSTRLVVAPGLESAGFCHIPAGQSGHPAERDYRSSHADWVQGAASPLLPGPAVAEVRLRPARGG